MYELGGEASDQLHPECPVPGQILFDESSNDGTDNATANRREHDVGYCILLVVCIPHVGNHSQSDGSTSGGQTTESAADNYGAVIWGEGARDLPEVD